MPPPVASVLFYAFIAWLLYTQSKGPRVSAALWIATASFFLGQAKVFPDPVRKVYLLAIPVLIVSLTLFYWLGRVAVRKREIHG